MPAFTQHGDTTYVFGIDAGYDAIPGIKLESLTIEGTPEFEATAKDLDGSIKAHVLGHDKSNFTASGFLITGAPPDPGVGFEVTIGAVATWFIIESVNETHSNVDFKKLEIAGKAFKLIENPTP